MADHERPGSDDRRYRAAVRRQSEAELLAHGTPVPGRITAALDLRGLYGPQVDHACGVLEPAVDMWEAGTLVPTGEQVQALSRLTGFPVKFFYQPLLPMGPVWVCSRGRGGCTCLQREDVQVPDPATEGRLF